MASSVTTRSRTLLFFSYRDSSARTSRRSQRRYSDDAPDDIAERQGLIGRRHVASHVDAAALAALPPKWVDISDQVEHIIAAVHPKIQALDRLHAKHVLPGFADRSAEEREIERVASDITRDFRTCHTLIQRIAPDGATHMFPPSTPHAARAAQNTQRALAAKLQELSGTFRKKQRVYMEKLQGHAIKNQDFLLASGAVSLRGADGLSALEEDIQASQQVGPQLVEAAPETALRSRELTELAKSIGALAELFKDLSALVIDQGTILDSVEYNVEQAAVNLEGAVRELNVATRHQTNTGRRKCIFLLILLILGLILVLIFKPRRRREDGDGAVDIRR